MGLDTYLHRKLPGETSFSIVGYWRKSSYVGGWVEEHVPGAHGSCWGSHPMTRTHLGELLAFLSTLLEVETNIPAARTWCVAALREDVATIAAVLDTPDIGEEYLFSEDW